MNHEQLVMGMKTRLSKSSIKERCLKEKDINMLENCDNFERIYPLQDYHHDELDEKYDVFAKKAALLNGKFNRG